VIHSRGSSRWLRGRARGIALAIGLTASLSIAVPAAAVQPYTFVNVETHVDDIDCGAFQANMTRTLSGTVSIYLDKYGNALRLQAPTTMTGTLSGNGKVIALRGHILFVIDFVKATYTFDGQVFMANQPGSGVVLQDTGVYMTADDGSFFEAGPHDVTDIGVPALCAALG
jgi:hypothetical protein